MKAGLQEEFETLFHISRNVDSSVISSSSISNVNDYRGTGFLVVFVFVVAALLEPLTSFQKVFENIHTRIFWTGLKCPMKFGIALALWGSLLLKYIMDVVPGNSR